MRTKRAALNFITDAVPQIILAFIGIFKIKVLLSYLGSDMLGVYQLYGQLLAYLSIAEAGLTSATMYHLYRPIGENNHKKINQILSASNYIFNRIGIFMFVAGLIISLNITFFIKETNLSNFYLMITFILFVLSNIINYFQVSHKILFDAEQKRYVSNNIFQTVQIIKGIVEIILVVLGFHLIGILIAFTILSLLANLVLYLYSKKAHPYINFKEQKDMSIWKEIKHLIPHKIGTIIAFNIDIVLISKFLGLSQVVIYSAYNYITESIRRIVAKIGDSTIAGVGNILVMDKHKAIDIFNEYNTFVFFIASVIVAPLLLVINDFVGIWYGKDLVVSVFTSSLFIFLLFYGIIRQPLNTFVSAAGFFKETKICTILESIINLVLSIILIHFWGINGVLIGTVISLIVAEYLIKPQILYSRVFNKNVMSYYNNNFKYLAILILIILLNQLLISQIFNPTHILQWFLFSLLVFIIDTAIFFAIYSYLGETKFIKRLLKIGGKNA